MTIMMELLWSSARAACLRYADGGLYESRHRYTLRLNGADTKTVETCVFSLFDLKPDTAYQAQLFLGDSELAAISFHTRPERFTLDVRDFGAAGDGQSDDTPAIQAAIMACPADSRVLVPAGDYLVSPLFLKSGLRLEIAKGATLKLHPAREKLPILPGVIQSADARDDLNLGTWEGNPLDCFAALLTGFDLEQVEIYGEGLLDGQAQQADWWQWTKTKRGGAWRGRMLFLNRCRDVTVQGLTVQNSPSWNLHPYFSENLRFLNITVKAPDDSPNTDGLNPESCRQVMIAGARFSLGDDCIAVKSGKIYHGSRYKRPSEGLEIMHCLMERGHGSLTIGSEMAGGVRDLYLHDCLMRGTDRGLRIKTRRGRGEQGYIDGIRFERVRMEDVISPIVVNSFYFCGPDGHAPWVQDRTTQTADHTTPGLGSLSFEDLEVVGAHTCAACFLGLPEKKIEHLRISRASFAFAPDARAASPAMADQVTPVRKAGVIASNVKRLELHHLTFDGLEGEAVSAEKVDELIVED